MYASTGAGGIYATAEDLFRYSNALDSGTLLPLEHQRPMVTRAFRIRPGVLYGYGWVVTQVNDTSVFVHHSGGNNGYTCEFARYPSNGVVIEVLGNRGFVDVGAIRDSISAMLFGDRYLAKRQPGHS
jgi:CubicO group peptidase (beta-lactamase class C family)